MPGEIETALKDMTRAERIEIYGLGLTG